MDKTFHMGPGNDRGKSEKIFRVTPQLPKTLSLSEQPTPINIYVADDIESKHSMGELWKCELRIMINNLMQNGDVSIVWNDKKIPPEKIRKADWIFQMRPRPDYVRGYRLHVPLEKDFLPKKGENTISISFSIRFIALVSVLTHIVSSAYTTSSYPAPGILCVIRLYVFASMCMSLNMAVMTTKNRYGDSGHPCLIPVLCFLYVEFPSLSLILNCGLL